MKNSPASAGVPEKRIDIARWRDGISKTASRYLHYPLAFIVLVLALCVVRGHLPSMSYDGRTPILPLLSVSEATLSDSPACGSLTSHDVIHMADNLSRKLVPNATDRRYDITDGCNRTGVHPVWLVGCWQRLPEGKNKILYCQFDGQSRDLRQVSTVNEAREEAVELSPLPQYQAVAAARRFMALCRIGDPSAWVLDKSETSLLVMKLSFHQGKRELQIHIDRGSGQLILLRAGVPAEEKRSRSALPLAP